MFNKLKNIFELQKKAGEVKKEISALSIDSEKLNGQIKVKVDGEFKIVDLQIDEGLLNKDNNQLLINNLRDCINEAQDKVKSMIAEKMRASLGGLNIPGM